MLHVYRQGKRMCACALVVRDQDIGLRLEFDPRPASTAARRVPHVYYYGGAEVAAISGS